jgi:hypothetical protein
LLASKLSDKTQKNVEKKKIAEVCNEYSMGVISRKNTEDAPIFTIIELLITRAYVD